MKDFLKRFEGSGLPMKDFEQFYSRMVFNCVAVNQDDHKRKPVSQWESVGVSGTVLTDSSSITIPSFIRLIKR